MIQEWFDDFCFFYYRRKWHQFLFYAYIGDDGGRMNQYDCWDILLRKIPFKSFKQFYDK